MGLVEDLKDELKRIPEFVLQKIDAWVKEHNKKDSIKIQASYFHPDPESGKGKIYFVTEPYEYSDKLSDKMLALEYDILNKDNVDVGLIEWPCGYEYIKDYGFLKELCLFDYVKAQAQTTQTS